MTSILAAIVIGLGLWFLIRDGGPWSRFIDRLEDKQGGILSLSALAHGQVYISNTLAEELVVGPGDTVYTYLGSVPTALEVTGLYE